MDKVIQWVVPVTGAIVVLFVAWGVLCLAWIVYEGGWQWTRN
jgi:hypothetical protein